MLQLLPVLPRLHSLSVGQARAFALHIPNPIWSPNASAPSRAPQVAQGLSQKSVFVMCLIKITQ